MKKNILIVEDDYELRKSLRKVLVANNFRVIEAADGAEALEMVEENAPDLVLLDFVLPKVSGETVCVKIKKDHPDIIVIALTEKSLSRDVIHGLQIGADDYISKPFVVEELIARIDTRLKGLETKDKLSETTNSVINKITLRESIALVAMRLVSTGLFFSISIMLIVTVLSLLDSYYKTIDLLPLYSAGLFVMFVVNIVISLFIILRWRSEYTEVEKKAVIKYSGIFSKKEQKYACNFVEVIKIEQDFLGTLFNYGTLELYDPALEEKIYLTNIADPKKTRDIIDNALTKDMDKPMPFVAK